MSEQDVNTLARRIADHVGCILYGVHPPNEFYATHRAVFQDRRGANTYTTVITADIDFLSKVIEVRTGLYNKTHGPMKPPETK